MKRDSLVADIHVLIESVAIAGPPKLLGSLFQIRRMGPDPAESAGSAPVNVAFVVHDSDSMLLDYLLEADLDPECSPEVCFQ